MQNRKTIETEMIQTIISYTDKITFFGLGGVVRAILSAVAAVIDELFYDLNQTKKSLFLATAEGEDLDSLARDYNMSRLTTSKAGVVLSFKGTASTLVPAGTQVKSISGIIFETLAALTIGTTNSSYDLYPCEPLTDKVEARATTTGSSGNVSAHTITTLVNPISGVTSVTNPSHAIGGKDSESDNEFRTRIVERIQLLNQGTLAFYEAVARDINNDILRVHAAKGESTREVSIFVASRSGTGLTTTELSELEASIKNYAPICAVPKCYNVTFKDVDVYARISLKQGFVLKDVFENISKNLAEYLDWSKLKFGIEIDDADVLSIIKNTTGLKDIDLSTFRPNTNIKCAQNSIPRLGTIYLENLNNTSESINYSPATSYIYKY